MLCNKDNDGYVLPLWFNDVDTCINFLKNKSCKNCLYFFKIDENLFKVGRSDRIIDRLRRHKSKLGDRISMVGIIGDIILCKQIENFLHSVTFEMRKDGKHLFESKSSTYDTETYEITDVYKEFCRGHEFSFKEIMEIILKVIKIYFLDSENYGFDVFNPNDGDKGLSKFLLEYS